MYINVVSNMTDLTLLQFGTAIHICYGPICLALTEAEAITLHKAIGVNLPKSGQPPTLTEVRSVFIAERDARNALREQNTPQTIAVNRDRYDDACARTDRVLNRLSQDPTL